MIDRSLESIAPQGIRVGPEKTFNLDVLHSRYGVEYQGGFGFDLLDAKMRRDILENVDEEDCLNLDVGGYVHSLSHLKPLGGSADFRTESLSDLKYFLQGGSLRINDNFFYLKSSNVLCPDSFAVGLAVRTLLTPYSSFLKINRLFDGVLKSNVKIFDDSIRVEKDDERNIYKVFFDMEVALVEPLEQLPYSAMQNPIRVEKSLAFYKILKNFVELPKCMNFNFGENGSPNTIAIGDAETFLAEHTLLRNILHLDSGKMNILELGALLGEFVPDVEKREVLAYFFGNWSASDFYKFRNGHLYDLRDNESSFSLEKLSITCFYSFNGIIQCDDLIQRLEECRNSIAQMIQLMGGFRGKPWSDYEKCSTPYNEIVVRVDFDKNKTPSSDVNRAVFGDHLGALKMFLQDGGRAFDMLMDIVKSVPFVVKESGAFNYPALKHYLENLVQDAIKLDPLSFCDFGGQDRRCAEIRNYARLLIGGAA